VFFLPLFPCNRVATQQGRGSATHVWRMQFEKISGKEDRWTNPLMGWTSTSDPLSTLGLTFPTKVAAIEYAKRNSYDFKVFEPHAEKQSVRNIAPFARSMSHHWDHTGVPGTFICPPVACGLLLVDRARADFMQSPLPRCLRHISLRRRQVNCDVLFLFNIASRR
jgi:ETC complex I subunit conserved region